MFRVSRVSTPPVLVCVYKLQFVSCQSVQTRTGKLCYSDRSLIQRLRSEVRGGSRLGHAAHTSFGLLCSQAQRDTLSFSGWSSNTLSPITPWIQPIQLKVSGMYIDYFHNPDYNVFNMVLGRKQSLSKVGLQRWIVYCMRGSFLSDIELRTSARRKLPVARQYYVQFCVGDTSRSTSTVKEAQSRIFWDEDLYLWVHVPSLTPED